MTDAASTLEQARDLMRQGRLPEAEQLYAQVLQAAPDNVEALNAVGVAALRQGDLQGALTRLGEALKLAPEQHAARLLLALALERSNERDRAVLQYARALNDAQARGRWLNADTTPPAMRPQVERAVLFVRAGRRAMLMKLLEPYAQRFGRAEMARVEQCLRIYLRDETVERPDPRQAPTFLFFPGLGASPYLDRSLFSWVEALEADSEGILAELMKLLPSDAGRERVFGSEELERVNLRGLDEPPSWTGYYFYRHGERRADNCASCPVTARALDRLPLVRLREHGPEVLYSVFTPGTHLLPHAGVTNTRLVGHLPLIIPENCALSVGGEIHEWQPGRVVVFDDTYQHEAWTQSAFCAAFGFSLDERRKRDNRAIAQRGTARD